MSASGKAKEAILITGGGIRLGKALAVGLAKQGYDIALHYNQSIEGATEVAKKVKNEGVSCELFHADLSQQEAPSQLIASVKSKMPHLSTLINNAAIIARSTLLNTKPEDYDNQFALNLRAPFFLTQSFAKEVTSGQVVNILDTYTTKSKTPYFSYLLTKKALKSFTEMAAYELSPAIRVNAICPGLVIPASWQEEALCEKKKTTLPLQELPTTDNILSACMILLQNTYLVGQLLYVDGGEHLL